MVAVAEAHMTQNFLLLIIATSVPFIASGGNVTIQLSGADRITATGAAAIIIDCQIVGSPDP
jgi:hypothetical protein